MRPAYRSLSALLIAVLPMGCDMVQQQALRGYMALNRNLTVSDGAVLLPEDTSVKAQAIAEGLQFPWDMAFLPDGHVLVTEKPGRLNRIDPATGSKTLISGIPEVWFNGQGGLLGVALHPQFADNGWLYLSYSVQLADEAMTTRLLRARLAGDELLEPTVLFTAQPALPGRNHFGGALQFDRDGLLYLSVGDRQRRENAQNPGSDLGKIHRFTADGRAAGVLDGARPSVYSSGHRNPQGLAMAADGVLWSAEHGPQGGDEINRLIPGANYGWPLITYGEEYGGGAIGEGTQRAGLEQPQHYYVPSIATAGIGFYTGSRLPQWAGSLFVGALRGTHLNRLEFTRGRIIETRLLKDLNMRIRDVAQGPDDLLYVLTENGILIRLGPA